MYVCLYVTEAAVIKSICPFASSSFSNAAAFSSGTSTTPLSCHVLYCIIGFENGIVYIVYNATLLQVIIQKVYHTMPYLSNRRVINKLLGKRRGVKLIDLKYCWGQFNKGNWRKCIVYSYYPRPHHAVCKNSSACSCKCKSIDTMTIQQPPPHTTFTSSGFLAASSVTTVFCFGTNGGTAIEDNTPLIDSTLMSCRMVVMMLLLQCN